MLKGHEARLTSQRGVGGRRGAGEQGAGGFCSVADLRRLPLGPGSATSQSEEDQVTGGHRATSDPHVRPRPPRLSPARSARTVSGSWPRDVRG